MDYPHNPDSVLEKPPGISGRIVAAARGVGGSGGPWGVGDEGSNANQPEGRGAAPSSRGEVTGGGDPEPLAKVTGIAAALGRSLLGVGAM